MIKKLFTILFIVICTSSFAQRIKVIEGDLSALKGVSGIKTEFTYDNMIIGKDRTEADYIAEKKANFNEKEPGRGDKWEKAWIDDRKERFEPQFRELFSKHSG